MSELLPNIEINRANQPYLIRYFLAGWHPPHPDLPAWPPGNDPALYLHRFVGDDPDNELHDHPWDWSQSLILAGGYREQRCRDTGEIEERFYLPGDVNILYPGDRHRVDLLDGDCWTLFMTGTFAQKWGFYDQC